MTIIEAIHAAKFLSSQGISCEIIDLRTVSPIDYIAIFKSVRKTKNVIVLDTGTLDGSISAEIVSKIIEKLWNNLGSKPERLAMPNFPEGTSFALTKDYHVTSKDIALKISQILKKEVVIDNTFDKDHPHDVPGDWFSGPF